MFKSEKVSCTNRSFPLYLIMAVESVNYDSTVCGCHVYIVCTKKMIYTICLL